MTPPPVESPCYHHPADTVPINGRLDKVEGTTYAVSMPSRNRGNLRAQRARRRFRAKLIRSHWFLNNGPCKKCGSSLNLQLDHIIPVGKYHDNSKIWEWTLIRRTHELSQCQILCKSCHSIKTRQENIESGKRFIKHGRARYRAGCKCQVCKDSAAKHKREQRLR